MYATASGSDLMRAFAPQRTARDAPLPHSLSDLLRLLGATWQVGATSDGFPLALRQLRADAALFHEGAGVECIYFVQSGAFKRVRTAEDGYEQVLGFALRGDLLGFDAICLGRHPTAAIALEDARVFALQVQDLAGLAASLPAFEPLLQKATSLELQRQGEVLQLMAAVAAEVRLARFLLQLSARMQLMGQSARRLYLRMCRRDIASHLGVAHETVSRSFTLLADWGCLRVDNREVEILDMGLLRQLASSTRGSLDLQAERLAGHA
ncbi:cyclic nucleotide-binding domain-containing protein [Paucibacter sediminis]|uniref:Cyclic nucleotide-binding domain-containing protein n=1 Tax=Paucibacter sediminis TaxID=3019553 RepID=A0AA95N9L2_9BURK|nr:cyclic nucleotide-binding domain-containing protein [Paucibacter sp. S2-9]WIT11130.1 cyclic nucleotide-binding domain-containing protein [Paucibacter sp. S2-9]